MRPVCDVCESAAAVLFCAADEASLCRPCDEKVHMCNKLASRHVRVKLVEPSEVMHCDICENSPAFFYCEIDGSSLCLQCDMIVHVGGKRTHSRYLLMRQRVEFQDDKTATTEDLGMLRKDRLENGNTAVRATQLVDTPPLLPQPLNAAASMDENGKADSEMIDLNMQPRRSNGRSSSPQVQ